MKVRGELADSTYLMAKCFAEKGKLLQRAMLETLAESKGLEDLVGRLKGTPYNEAVSRITRPYTSDKLEMAFREHLASTHYSLIRVSPRNSFLTAYYNKHLIWNLKTIAKGKALGLTYEEIASKVNLYAEELIERRNLIVKALTAPDLPSLVQTLGKTEFSQEIAKAAQLYSEKGDLRIFDTYLDKAFYTHLLTEYNKLSRRTIYLKRRPISEQANVRPLVSVDIDAYNILSALRAKVWELTAPQTRELVIEAAFNLTQKKLNSIIGAPNLNEALKKVAETPYGKLIPPGVVGEEAIRKLENEFEIYIYKQALKAFTWQISGLGVALALIKLKEAEVRNLSALAFGVEQGLSAKEVMSKMTFLS
ncbi:MAG: V-type ATPase subunit [Nitrososphaerales archaeon]